jgi:hypothetical protein
MAKKKGTLQVDFTGVEAGGGGRLLPEEDFKFEVKEAEIEVGAESKKEYIKLTLEVVEGEFEGTKAWDNLSTQPQALWKLRGFMEAAGLPTEDGVMEIDPDEFVGLIVMGRVIHEDYKGKPKHRLDGYSAIEDDAPAPSKGSKGGSVKKKPAKPEEDDVPTWKLRQNVSFKDGKKTLTGVITAIDDENVTVKVGRDEYEMTTSDLEAA